MELRHLRYFVAVAETLHFGRAARRLAMAQPPLSQQIKALEEELGVELLSRTKRQVALTAAGALFLAEARKILARAEQAVQVARRAARGEIGQLGIGVVGSAVYGRVPEIFREMRRRYPDVSLNIHELTSGEQVTALKRGRIDVGFVRPPVMDAESLNQRVVWKEPLMAALPEGHPLSRHARIPLAALAGQPFIHIPRHIAPGYYDLLMGICARAGFTPHIVQEARTTPTIVSLVAGGMGIALLPSSLHTLKREGVVYVPIEPPSPTTDMAVIWRSEAGAPVLMAFLELMGGVGGARIGCDPGKRIDENGKQPPLIRKTGAG